MLTQATLWYADAVALISATTVAPWAIALGLAGLTLLVEDAAIAAGILLAAEGLITTPLALVAVAGGIAGGDLSLYLLGAAARRVSLVRRHLVDSRAAHQAQRLLDGNLTLAVLIARVVPGLRLAVYTASGLFAVPFGPFALLVLGAVAAWTGLLFWLGSAAGVLLSRHWGLAPWQTAVALFALFALLPMLAGRLAAATQRLRR